MKNFVLLVTVLTVCIDVIYTESEFASRILKSTSQCVCPEHSLSYECTVEGDSTAGATVWSGTAFDCTDLENELTFIHIRRFTETSLGCNDGAIVGRGVRVMGNSFTSQINITVEHSMEGKTVMCSYNNGSIITVVGNTSISLTKVPLPPPTDVSVNITDVLTGPLRLTFMWSTVAVDCTAIHYITEFDCGSCPNTTDGTEVVCSDIVIGSQCRFTVQTQVCDSVNGNVTVVPLTLKVPVAPEVNVIPTYGHELGHLTKLTVFLKDMEHFNISDDVSGSPTFYSIELTNYGREVILLTNIPVSSCIMGICQYTFNLNYSSCRNLINDVINVNVFAVNVLGSGLPHNRIVDVNNVILDVTFDANFSQVTCKFLLWRHIDNNSLNCSIFYENSSQNLMFFIMDMSMTDTVILDLSTNLLPNVKYHFTVTATYGKSTTVVEGIFTKHEDIPTSEATRAVSPFTVNGLVFGAVVGVMGTVIIIFILVFIFITIIAFVLASRKATTQNSVCNNCSVQLTSQISTERNVAYESIFQVTHTSSRIM